MEPDRAPSVQLHQRQLRWHAAAHLGAVPGGHSRHHHQGRPDRTSGAALRQVSDRHDGHQRPHADTQPGTTPYLPSLELHTPPAFTRLPIDLNSGGCSLTAPKNASAPDFERLTYSAKTSGSSRPG